MIGPVFYQSDVYWASLHEIMLTEMQLWTTEQEVKRACLYSWSPSRFSGTLSFLCLTFRWLCLSHSLSVSWHPGFLELALIQRLTDSFLPVSQYCLSTGWLTISQHEIFPSTLRGSRAACCFKNRWQSPRTHPHVHVLYPPSLTHWQVCIRCTCRYTTLTLRGLYVLDNTAEPTV